MKNYAMVLMGNVIEVIQTDDNTVPQLPPNQHGYPVSPIECDDTVTRGMRFDEKTQLFHDDSGDDNNMSQLDRIEQAVKVSQTEIAQTAIDAYTLELMNGGLL